MHWSLRSMRGVTGYLNGLMSELATGLTAYGVVTDPPAICLAEAKATRSCVHHELYREFWRWSDQALDYAMEQASSVVLGGFKLGTEAKMILYPNRYIDRRGEKMFPRVMSLL
jgi:hypothetical protein